MRVVAYVLQIISSLFFAYYAYSHQLTLLQIFGLGLFYIGIQFVLSWFVPEHQKEEFLNEDFRSITLVLTIFLFAFILLTDATFENSFYLMFLIGALNSLLDLFFPESDEERIKRTS